MIPAPESTIESESFDLILPEFLKEKLIEEDICQKIKFSSLVQNSFQNYYDQLRIIFSQILLEQVEAYSLIPPQIINSEDFYLHFTELEKRNLDFLYWIQNAFLKSHNTLKFIENFKHLESEIEIYKKLFFDKKRKINKLLKDSTQIVKEKTIQKRDFLLNYELSKSPGIQEKINYWKIEIAKKTKLKFESELNKLKEALAIKDEKLKKAKSTIKSKDEKIETLRQMIRGREEIIENIDIKDDSDKKSSFSSSSTSFDYNFFDSS